MSFLRFTCAQCTRRLGRLAQQSSNPLRNPLGRQAIPRLSLEYTPSLATHHLYSTASGRRVGRAVLTPSTFARVRFTRADVPPREFWDARARAPLVTDLSADECLQTARAYADAALKNAPGWRERLITTTTDQSPDSGGKDKTLSAYTLHYVAVMIALAARGDASHMATHIFHTLTGLDYVPSILTIVHIGLSRKLLDWPQFEPAVQGLERTLRRIDDDNGSKIDLAADACTLRALIYAAKDTREGDKEALRWFRRAYEIGGKVPTTSPTAGQPDSKRQPKDEVRSSKDSGEVPRAHFDPYWQWKASFARGVAAISIKRGDLEKARAIYAMVSSELDDPTVYLEMANVLEKMGKADGDEYVEALEKAASSGNKKAAQKMGTREWARAAEEGLSKWEKRKRQVFAEEWMGIAGVMSPTEA
ncbi:hypothetical protein FHL15_006581 [Xylaria flabelliformis]|uniref:Uncharacterized protein n=1 Tax=Xylaria flabelliformis TaxID=2512241 RepID=A0A553HWT5_9PEZI|nr:hypothetical protein FHL15_006581 [Xylaria flabelliformis]